MYFYTKDVQKQTEVPVAETIPRLPIVISTVPKLCLGLYKPKTQARS